MPTVVSMAMVDANIMKMVTARSETVTGEETFGHRGDCKRTPRQRNDHCAGTEENIGVQLQGFQPLHRSFDLGVGSLKMFPAATCLISLISRSRSGPVIASAPG